MSEDRSLAKKVVGGIYSLSAGKLYESVVVHGSFRLFGGELNQLVQEQGRRAVESAQGRPILDLPVGTAYFTVPTARLHHGLIVGVDIAEGMVRETNSVATRMGIDNLKALQGDAHRLPFPDNTFGAILCTNGLQVMPGLHQSLLELARVLQPGGMLYVSVVTLPVSRLLPGRTRARLPTIVRSGIHVAEAISDAGVYVTRVDRSRLATLIQALKPVAPGTT